MRVGVLKTKVDLQTHTAWEGELMPGGQGGVTAMQEFVWGQQ